MKKKNLIILIAIMIISIVFCMGILSKNRKISIIESIRNKISQIAENIQNENKVTVVDVTNLIKGKETEHQHLWKTMFDDEKHWEECTTCGIKNGEINHSFIINWILGYESCSYSNGYTKTCECGYSITGHKPCVWNGKTYDHNTYDHGKVCSVCKRTIYYGYYLNSYGNGNLYECNGRVACQNSIGTKIDCSNGGKCSICGTSWAANHHKPYANLDTGKICCIFCKKEFGTFTTTLTSNGNVPASYTFAINLNLTNGATFSRLWGANGERNKQY